MTHSKIVEIAYKWVLKNASCGVAFKEFKSVNYSGEIPDVIGFGSGHSVLVECKVSRNDFLSDKSKPFRQRPEIGMGDKRYYCCPKGLISKDELPYGWGLIYINEKNKAIVHYSPQIEIVKEYGTRKEWIKHKKCIKSEHMLLYSALRRLHLRGRIDEIYDPL